MGILGIDPSTVATGWFYVYDDGDIAYGVLSPPSSCKTNQEKFLYIYNEFNNLISALKPTDVACENQYKGPRIETLKTLSQLRGVLMLACEQAGITMHYYWPSTVKLQCTGNGKATKQQMVDTVCEMYNITNITGDMADAAAVALAHHNATCAPRHVGVKKNKKKK